MRLGSQRLRFLAGLLLLLAGLEITVTLTYLARWVGLVLMIFGLGILVITARKKPKPKKGEEERAIEAEIEEKKTLADKLISILTFNGKLRFILPVIGGFLIIFVYAFNFFFRESFEIGVNDTITILLGVTLILYNYVPQRFDRERDFVFLFFVFLFLILVLPITLYSIYAGPIEENTNSPFIYHLLARPTSDMLNLIGIPSSVHTINSPETVKDGVFLGTSGVHIVYKNMGEDAQTTWSSVVIGLSCTGLYSVSIFISGFVSFILIEYRRFDIRVASLLTLGIFTSWFANIIRMTIIVAVGSYYGGEALKWTHANLGIFIFMLWVGIFWALMFKLLVPKREIVDKEPGDEKEPTNKDKEESQTDLVQEDGDESEGGFKEELEGEPIKQDEE